MIYQFLYARKNAGYCQINEDVIPFNKNELIKLESLKSYYIADNIDLDNLPQAFYSYNEMIGEQRVGIIGKTTYVPAGKSDESGLRNTSFMHKYIYTDRDYENTLRIPIDALKNHVFYETVEEYKAKESHSSMNTEGGSFNNPSETLNAFSLNDVKLADFIFCCLDAFSDSGKRVYIYLPSNDTKGTIHAKNLIQMLLSAMPANVVSNAGYLTYASTFHNVTTNPIPGNISVIFIPDNENNRLQAKNEKDRNYIFDFKDYSSPRKGEIYAYLKNVIDEMTAKMKGISLTQPTLDLPKFYLDLENVVLPFCKLDINFIGSYSFLWMIWNRIVCPVIEEKKHTGYELSWEDSIKIQSRQHQAFENIKNRKTIASSIVNMIKNQEELNQNGKIFVTNVAKINLAAADFDDKDLEWIDMIYSEGELLKNIIVQRLCEQCLLIMQNNFEDQDIFTIIDYLYKDVDIKGIIMDEIYSNSHYYQVATKLIEMTLEPLIKNTSLPIDKKLDKIFSSVISLYTQYPNLVLDRSFIEEIGNAVDSIINGKETYEDAEHLKNLVTSMEPSLLKAYLSIAKKICYSVIQKSYQEPNMREINIVYAKKLYNWVMELSLSEYEASIHIPQEKSFVMKIEEILDCHELESLIYEGDISKINQVFRAKRQNKRDEICRKFYNKLVALINRYNGDEITKTDFNQYFEYLYCSGEYDCMKMVIDRILKVDGVSALRRFNNTIDLNINPGRLNMSKDMMKRELNIYLVFNNKKSLITEADKYFLESLGISDYYADLSKSEDEITLPRQRRDNINYDKKGISKKAKENEDKEGSKKPKIFGIFNKPD